MKKGDPVTHSHFGAGEVQLVDDARGLATVQFEQDEDLRTIMQANLLITSQGVDIPGVENPERGDIPPPDDVAQPPEAAQSPEETVVEVQADPEEEPKVESEGGTAQADPEEVVEPPHLPGQPPPPPVEYGKPWVQYRAEIQADAASLGEVEAQLLWLARGLVKTAFYRILRNNPRKKKGGRPPGPPGPQADARQPDSPLPYPVELPGTENTSSLVILPLATISSLESVMGVATYQSLRTDNPAMTEFFQGFLTGAHTVLGIVCGALNIDTSFLEVPDDDDGLGPTAEDPGPADNA